MNNKDLTELATKLCLEIENLDASEQQTKMSIMASEIRQALYERGQKPINDDFREGFIEGLDYALERSLKSGKWTKADRETAVTFYDQMKRLLTVGPKAYHDEVNQKDKAQP